MVTMCRVLIALLTLCVSFLDFGAAYPIQNYPVNWSLVPITPSPERNLNSLYLGECVCDITRGYCDPFCCCDIDCSKEAVALFEYCLPEQYGYPYVDYCYKENSATQLKKINLFIEKKTQAYDAVCIVRANHPSELYRFFQVPTNVKKPTGQPIFHRALQNGTYRAGSPLMALKYVDGGNDTRYQCNGYFQLPVQSDRGSCEFRYGQNVQFLHPINGVSCSMSGAELCENSPISVFANLLVAPPGNSSQLIDTAFPVVLRILNETGEEVAVIDPLDVNWDRTLDSRVVNGGCLNSVTGVELIFTYNATPSGFTLLDSVVNVRTARNISLTAFAPISFRSSFRVNNNSADTDEFIPATVGFTIGGIVRAGTMVHQGDKKAIAERKYGFAVPSGSGSCALNNLRHVRFMHSVAASGCSIGVTEATLQKMCEQGTEQQIMGVLNTTMDGLYGLIDYVAVTGDALSNDTTSWIPIDGLQNLDFSPGQFDPVTRECRNITVGVRYSFVIARAGAEYNPQDIIVGAFAESIIGTWKMRGKDIFTATTEGTQYLRFQAIFSRYNPDSQATVRRRVKAPPILPSLDDTIFYPFS